MSQITLGLAQIMVGTAAPDGSMPEAGSLAKLGKTYKDTCKLVQPTSEVTEHYEEGQGTPEVRKKQKKVPALSFSVMDPDPQFLADYIGGTFTAEVPATSPATWSFDGTEEVANKAFQVQSEEGLWVDIPNGDVEATINSEFMAKGIFLVDFTVTPLTVTSGKSIRAYTPLA